MTRNELPKYLKTIGLNGIGAEIGVESGNFSELLLKRLNGLLGILDIS